MAKSIPTIKGIFVNSQINSVKREKGEEGLKELEKRFGSIKFNNIEDVPVSEEVRLIECALQIINEDSIPEKDMAFEAGRLHFKNFSTTPLAKLTFGVLTNLKYILLHSKYIIQYFF